MAVESQAPRAIESIGEEAEVCSRQRIKNPDAPADVGDVEGFRLGRRRNSDGEPEDCDRSGYLKGVQEFMDDHDGLFTCRVRARTEGRGESGTLLEILNMAIIILA